MTFQEWGYLPGLPGLKKRKNYTAKFKDFQNLPANTFQHKHDATSVNPFTGNPGQTADVHSILPQSRVKPALDSWAPDTDTNAG